MLGKETKPQDVKTDKKPATAVAVKDQTPKAPTRNISAVAREAILAGLSNADALVKVKAEFPDCNTTTASIAWYRNDLRKKGQHMPSPKPPKVEKPVKEKSADAKTEVKAKAVKGQKQAGASEFE